MTAKRIIPKFATEAEEAQWWFDHADELAEDFITAAADGTLGRGRLARRFGIISNVIAIDQKDAETAVARAKAQGIEYEAYMKNLVHTALERDTPEPERKAS